MLYYYWTVRYVPDTVRPTTVGVGVVVSSQSTLDVACKFITNPSDIVDIGGPQENMIESLKDIEKEISNIGVSSKIFTPIWIGLSVILMAFYSLTILGQHQVLHQKRLHMNFTTE